MQLISKFNKEFKFLLCAIDENLLLQDDLLEP